MAISIKTPAEQDAMRLAGRLTADVLDMIGPHVQPGVSTDELDRICHDFIVNVQHAIPAPLNYRGFPKSICTSVNHVVCHGIPGDRILKSGDIVNVDITVIKDGFHGDSSRMFFVGKARYQGERVSARVLRPVLWKGIAQARPGNHLGDIGHAIQTFVEAQDFSSVVREYCGHGIGRVFHEDPQVLHYGEPHTGAGTATQGQTFTIEPMVNIGKRHVRLLPDGWTVVTRDHSLSAQWEHTDPDHGQRVRSPDSRRRRDSDERICHPAHDVLTEAARALAAASILSSRRQRHRLDEGRRPCPATPATPPPDTLAGTQLRHILPAATALWQRFLTGQARSRRNSSPTRARLVDLVIRTAWRGSTGSRSMPDCALVAVGGYGRGELHPCSDVDLLVLMPGKPLASRSATACLGIPDPALGCGIEIGHSVRNAQQCRQECRAQDLTVLTTLMESRLPARAGKPVAAHAGRDCPGKHLAIARLFRRQAAGTAGPPSSLRRHRPQPGTGYQRQSGRTAGHTHDRLGRTP
jgi:methionine aminopeptidase type I